MGIGDILLGKGPKTLHGIKKMHRSKDVRGLVKALGIAPANVIPYALDYLNDIEGVGFYPAMMEAGLPEMFSKIMETSGSNSKRKAIRLIVKFVAWEKGCDFLSERNITHMVRMLQGADHDLKCWISYCLPEAISMGHGPVVSIEGGIPLLVDQLDSDDPSLLTYTILALDELVQAGYYDDLVRLGLSGKLLRCKSFNDDYVKTYATDLYQKINTWRDKSARVGDVIKKRDKSITVIKTEKTVNLKEEEMEDHTGDDKYVRPKAKVWSKKKRNVLTSHGCKSKDEEDEEIVELPSRSTPMLKDRMKKTDEEEEEFEISLD